MHLYLDRWANGFDFGERTATQVRKREGQKVDGEVTFIWCTDPCTRLLLLRYLFLGFLQVRVDYLAREGWKEESGCRW